MKSHRFRLHFALLALSWLLRFCAPAEAQTFETFYKETRGEEPRASLVEASDGNFYGTTAFGGTTDDGTFFKVSPAGVLTTLASFNVTTGTQPNGRLVIGADGNFYGVTSNGGTADEGTLFKVTPAGQITVLANFGGGNGYNPSGPLLLVGGDLYGAARDGGSAGFGLIFKYSAAGVLSTVAEFDGMTNGANPNGGMVRAGDGNIYGTSNAGDGTVFKLTPAGVLSTLAEFDFATAFFPTRGLVLGNDGNLYGATQLGGSGDAGTVFKVTLAGVLSVFVDLATVSIGQVPAGGLTRDAAGNFYGATSTDSGVGAGIVFKVSPTGTFTELGQLTNIATGDPESPPIMGSDGNVYGTASGATAGEYGSVYKIALGGPAPVLSKLTVFGPQYGESPSGPLAEVSPGVFFGVTSGGGSKDEGTLFKLTSAGQVSVLVDFNGPNGTRPVPGLTKGPDGNFWGATSSGGANNAGTIFKITPSGQFSTVAAFDGNAQGVPARAPVFGSNGNLYGACAYEGPNGLGCVYQMTPAGVFSQVVAFDGTNGKYATSGLMLSADGNFYGATQNGGATDEGLIYKLTPGMALSKMADLSSATVNNVFAPLTDGGDGNLYGVSATGGANGEGTFFRMTPTGTLTVLRSFSLPEGASPRSRLVKRSDGNFYGTLNNGGPGGGQGTIFKITPTGTLTNLYAFNGTEGENPEDLIVGSDGSLYGAADWMTLWRIRFGIEFSAPSVANVTTTGATLGATVASSQTVTARGVVLARTAQNANPQIGGANVTVITSPNAGIGTFTVNATGLAPHTSYSWAAYATSGSTTTYSTPVSTFTTANTEPSAPNGTATGTTGDQRTVAVTFPVTDADGDPVTLSAASSGTGITVNSFSAANRTVTFTPAANFTGPGTFTYTVDDGSGSPNATATGTITVTVTDNDPPVIALNGPNVVQVERGGTFVDSGAGALDGVDGLLIPQTSGTLNLNVVGDYVLTYSATDAANNTGSATRTVQVRDTTAPTLPVVQMFSNNPGSQTLARVGDRISVIFAGNEPLTNVSATILGRTATVTGNLQAWTAQIIVEAGDAQGAVPFSITYGDLAQNPGTAVTTVTNGGVLIDTLPPSPPSQPALSAASDSGSSNSDGLTKETSLTFTGTAEVGATVTLFDGATAGNFVVAADGTYSITQTFADGTRLVSARATDAAGNVGAPSAATTVTVDTTPPTVVNPGTVSVPATDPNGANVTLSTTASDNVTPNLSVTFTPSSGSFFLIGSTPVTATATDAAGNTGTALFTVLVGVATTPTPQLADGPVPGAGEAGSGVPAGALWRGFGVPGVDDAGNGLGVPVFRGSFASPGATPRQPLRQDGVFGYGGAAALLAKTGDAAPDTDQGTFATFGEPVGNGGTAFLATIRDKNGKPVKAAGLWSNAFSDGDRALHLVAGLGEVATGTGESYRAIDGLALNNGNHIFWTATLTGPAAQARALFRHQTLAQGAELVLRNGDAVAGLPGVTVRSFIALREGGTGGVLGVSASSGSGRTDGGLRTAVLATLSDRSVAVMSVAPGVQVLYARTGAAAPGVANATFRTLGLPAMGGDAVAFRAVLAPVAKTTEVTKDNAAAIYLEAPGRALSVLVRQGPVAWVGGNGTLTALSDPVLDLDGNVAFYGRIAETKSAGLFIARAGAGGYALAKVAEVNGDAPDLAGVKLGSFTGLALPQEPTAAVAGPVFVAKLKSGATKVQSSDERALFACDATGVPKLLVRTGSQVSGKTLRSIDAFSFVANSPTQARASASGSKVIYRATFTDKTQGILEIPLP